MCISPAHFKSVAEAHPNSKLARRFEVLRRGSVCEIPRAPYSADHLETAVEEAVASVFSSDQDDHSGARLVFLLTENIPCCKTGELTPTWNNLTLQSM